jgi:hypothetical protein
MVILDHGEEFVGSNTEQVATATADTYHVEKYRDSKVVY